MDVEKTLCGSGRLEPLHLALSSPHTLGRCGAKVDLSVVVQFSSSGMATAPIAQAQRSLRPASRNGRLRSGSRSRWPGRSAGCRPVPSNRARQKARQPASPRPRTRSSNPVPSSRESRANLTSIIGHPARMDIVDAIAQRDSARAVRLVCDYNRQRSNGSPGATVSRIAYLVPHPDRPCSALWVSFRQCPAT
jgi:hypothetical protein